MSLKALGRQTFIYGFGHILTRLVTFLLLPFYTNILSQTEFGIISLIFEYFDFGWGQITINQTDFSYANVHAWHLDYIFDLNVFDLGKFNLNISFL